MFCGLSSSPFIEALREWKDERHRGAVLVYLIDEYAVQQLKIVRWAKVDICRQRGFRLNLDEEDEKKKLEELKAEF